jgi:hypothetical protein
VSDVAVNRAIERLLNDESFYHRVVECGGSVLEDDELSPRDVDEIVAAVRSDRSLHQMARFGPLFAAASASATKVG